MKISQDTKRALSLFAGVALLFVITGLMQSWNLALDILNIGLLSAIMALGVNIQWGYAGLFNTGVMGFVALGGLAVVLVSAEPTPGGWGAGGWGILLALLIAAATLSAAVFSYRKTARGWRRTALVSAILILGFVLYRGVFDPAVDAIESIEPSKYGNLGGLGLPSLLAWPLGAALAALVAWGVGKIALGLRSDYLAIATLGIAEIVIAVLKNEDWLARGVKNVIGLPRPWPAPVEVDLQADPGFLDLVQTIGADPVTASTIAVKLIYATMFGLVVLGLIWLCERALNSPWGRMMRAIRDNEVAAEAMGKNVKKRHLQVFILGSAVLGLGGAIMVSMQGQLTPASYIPLRFTFLIWVMVIFGGSGNNWGSVLGALLVWWLWVMVEPIGAWAMHWLTAPLPSGELKAHLLGSAAHMRYVTMGIILLVVLRFAPRGLLQGK